MPGDTVCSIEGRHMIARRQLGANMQSEQTYQDQSDKIEPIPEER